MEKTPKLLELASKLAEKELLIKFKGKVYVDESADEPIYTEEVQDYFNKLYDEYTDFLIDLNLNHNGI